MLRATPDPTVLHPLPAHQRAVFLKPLVSSPKIEVGETLDIVTGMPSRGDTVVGNDVRFGYQRTVIPGVRIGDGAVIATGSVVTADVPPYTIVGGNPAKPIRRRFDDADIERLLRAAWWDWPVDLVTEHCRTVMAGTPADVARIAAEHGLEKAVPTDDRA